MLQPVTEEFVFWEILHVFGFGIEFLENKDICHCKFGNFIEKGAYRQVDLLR